MESQLTSAEHKAQINFQDPDERQVMRAIFANVPSNEPRGFRDVFTDLEILTMAASPLVEWSHVNRAWIRQTAGALCD